MSVKERSLCLSSTSNPKVMGMVKEGTQNCCVSYNAASKEGRYAF